MAVRLKFDATHNVIPPTFVLATRSGRKLGAIRAENVSVSDSFNDKFDLNFIIHRDADGTTANLWSQIVDFKLLWCREWDLWFEIYVETKDDNDTTKYVTCVSVGEAELSQIVLYGIEINTESDILRDDYVPTVLFDENNPNASLLNRIMEKSPHYSVKYVAPSIASIQRTFQFNGVSIYDALKKISEEIDCIFVIDSSSDRDGNIVRGIRAYDLESYCIDCGKRGPFLDQCTECNSSNIIPGYGNDTNIFVSTDNLADGISLSVDNASVKNCFRLKAGDDLMTAAVINCNPSGGQYIWYFSDEMKSDMSDELSSKLTEYNNRYLYYYKDHIIELPMELRNQYNELVTKYSVFRPDIKSIPWQIKGYPPLMDVYFDTIDFSTFLKDGLMPSPELIETSAAEQAGLLTSSSLSPVAVQNIESCSEASATSAVLSVAKIIVDQRFKVKVKTGSYQSGVWSGSFTVSSYTKEDDVADSATVTVTVNDDYEAFVRQQIDSIIRAEEKKNDVTDIASLFSLGKDEFVSEIKKYCLSSLTLFGDACQACLDILVKQGIADKETWADKNPDMYNEVYMPFYEKLGLINEEERIRESEIGIISGIRDADGDIITPGVQNYLDGERNQIYSELDIVKFLGEKQWLELSAYRREDSYENSNFISDGLNNTELFRNAMEFFSNAQKEIFKSATMQHSLSADLRNLLVMKEFYPIVDNFSVGNWIRIGIDGSVYKLRLLKYQIDFDNPEGLRVEFSDVERYADGLSDTKDILDQASSMATSYNTVSRQASQGNKGNERVSRWVSDGLSLTKMKIIDSADNQNIVWDSHGLLCREKLVESDKYDNKQLKIINRGLYLTDDNWLTSKAGIGDFTFYNPETKKYEEAYGVIADTIVGNLILSEKVGVYNTNNSITLDQNGLIITTEEASSSEPHTAFTIQRREIDTDGVENYSKLLYIDSDGNLVLNGSVNINASSSGDSYTLNDVTDLNRIDGLVRNSIDKELNKDGGVYDTISNQALSQRGYTDNALGQYKADVGQYLRYDENGLSLGAESSKFKTVIDNRRVAFYDGDDIAAYISDKQLYIANAVIKNTLSIGNFFFAPRADGGVSVIWRAV